MKLLVDMNLSPRWAEALTQAGFAATHWSNIGAASAPDGDILAYAHTHDLVLLTHDLDFSAILAATGGDAPSVVQLRAANLAPEVLAPTLAAALRSAREALADGAVLSVSRDRVRVGRAVALRRPCDRSFV